MAKGLGKKYYVSIFLERIDYDTVVGAPDFIAEQKTLEMFLAQYDTVSRAT